MVGKEAFIATYMMASGYRGTIYIGVTSELLGRAQTHREGRLPGFTRQHGVKKLVRYENHDLMTDAIQREKSLKRWPRQWKINLIERDNPRWDDLYPALVKPVWLPPPQWG